MIDQTSQVLFPSGAEISTQIKSFITPHEKIYLSQFILNCHHKQDAAALIYNADNTLIGGILCDGVSESPASGDFAKYIVNAIKSKLSLLDGIKSPQSLSTHQLEPLFDKTIEDYYEKFPKTSNSEVLSPKSTFILYLYWPISLINSVSSHLFFYLGDGKISVWDKRSSLPPSEFLLEYHNETGALLNVLRKNISVYTKQYPISKVTLNLPTFSNRCESVLVASDGLEPYFDDFIQIFRKNPEMEKFIKMQQSDNLQSLLLKELFGDLKIIPNDDISFILALHERI